MNNDDFVLQSSDVDIIEDKIFDVKQECVEASSDRALSDVPVAERPTLRQGDSGEWVTELQTELRQLTFYTGSINGSFDSSTASAVREFQRNNKITVDGVVGRETWSALIFLYAPLATCPGSGLMPTTFKGIVIDAGHGGTDPGAIGNGIIEKDLALAISLYQNDRFYELNIPHYLTRTTDETFSREERVRRVKSAFGTDPGVILISNHLNAGGGEDRSVTQYLYNN